MPNPATLPNEQITFALRELYDRYGYSHYKMNKFEEYDLYARNKGFLTSESVITFTDTNGKLMALKPDVTLSIVKNTKDAPGIRKLYYHENVYRVSKGTRSFKELMQVGLEAIGDVDEYCIYEVLKLAAESLRCIGRDCILEISDLDLLTKALSCVGLDAEGISAALVLIGQKNLHELRSLLQDSGCTQEAESALTELVSFYGTPEEALEALPRICRALKADWSPDFFLGILAALNAGKHRELLRVDFSVSGDFTYYNGFIFRGYAEGIPFSILSGGQYDGLMRSMQRKSRAIGFAVYLDILEQYTYTPREYDVDNVLLYDSGFSIAEIEARAKELTAGGESILLLRQLPPGLRCRRVITMAKGRGGIC